MAPYWRMAKPALGKPTLWYAKAQGGAAEASANIAVGDSFSIRFVLAVASGDSDFRYHRACGPYPSRIESHLW